MMKRGLSVLIALLLVLSMTGCGGGSDGDIQKPAEVAGDFSTEQHKNEEIVPEETVIENEIEEIAISETILVDEAGIKITAKSFDAGGVFGPEIKLLIENDSGEDLTVQSRNTSVHRA